MTMERHLSYLATEVFGFVLNVNPHSRIHDTVENYVSSFGGVEPVGQWLSEHQKYDAINSNKLVEGQIVGAEGKIASVVWGTDLAGVIERCALHCRDMGNVKILKHDVRK